MCLSSSFIMSSSLAQLSDAFSVHASTFSAQQTFTRSYFHRTILGLVGKISSWLKINKRGVAIRMSWCAFFEKINSRGGRLFRTGEYFTI